MGRDNIFSKRKTSLGIRIFYIIIAIIFALGVFMIIPDNSEPDISEEEVPVNSEVNTSEKQSEHNSGDNFDTDDKNSVIIKEDDSYYILKETDGLIKLFYVQDNVEELVKVTDIPYDLISKEDQDEFSKGIILETKEDLDEILQDFES